MRPAVADGLEHCRVAEIKSLEFDLLICALETEIHYRAKRNIAGGKVNGICG